MTIKYVQFYGPSAEAGAKARLHFADGTGAMAVFTAREAAEEFAKEDPFVVHGVVSGWFVKERNEAIFSP